MGASESKDVLKHHPGKQHRCRRTYAPLPEKWRTGAPGSVIFHFSALPPGYDVEDTNENAFWWVDAQFLHLQDDQMVVSVAAYIERPGLVPVFLDCRIRGLIYTLQFAERLRCSVIKGTSSSSYPHVVPHPNGIDILYIGRGQVIFMSLDDLAKVTKNKASMTAGFRYTCCAQNGHYVCVISRIGCTYLIEILHYDGSFLLRSFSAQPHKLHKLCTNFKDNHLYTAHIESCFSPNSKYLAVGISFGMLIVLTSPRLDLQCLVIPGMFNLDDTALSNARSFDFDPRFCSPILAFGDVNNKVHICDIVSKQILSCITVDVEGKIDCIKYGHRAEVLAVATSEATIFLYDPDSCDFLYSLDGANQGPLASMQMRHYRYPQFIRMSFSRSGDILAATSTDGVIRLWQLRPQLSLQHLARLAILRHTKFSRLDKLPLPSKLLLYLLEWPEGDKVEQKQLQSVTAVPQEDAHTVTLSRISLSVDASKS